MQSDRRATATRLTSNAELRAMKAHEAELRAPKDEAASAMLAALKAVTLAFEIGRIAEGSPVARKVRAAIAQAEAAGIRA